LRAELKFEMAGLRTGLKSEVSGLRTDSRWPMGITLAGFGGLLKGFNLIG
jgi:hypothetical protein